MAEIIGLSVPVPERQPVYDVLHEVFTTGLAEDPRTRDTVWPMFAERGFDQEEQLRTAHVTKLGNAIVGLMTDPYNVVYYRALVLWHRNHETGVQAVNKEAFDSTLGVILDTAGKHDPAMQQKITETLGPVLPEIENAVVHGIEPGRE